ncbi:hypothetical protein AAE478_007741 [Parahypoxylon ruwenzoriense]
MCSYNHSSSKPGSPGTPWGDTNPITYNDSISVTVAPPGSHPGSSFMPINAHESLLPESTFFADEGAPSPPPTNPGLLSVSSQCSKRPRILYEDNNNGNSNDNDNDNENDNDNAHRSKRTCDPKNRNLVAGPIQGVNVICNASFADEQFRLLAPETTAYTPGTIDAFGSSSNSGPSSGRPTEPIDSAILGDARLQNNKNSGNGFEGGAANPDRINADTTIDFDDDYPLDDGLMEEDMACLLHRGLGHTQETRIPPSSVTIDWGHDSRSALEYDPTLKYSSPLSSSEKASRVQKGPQLVDVAGGPGDVQEDLLDEDVDWNVVYAMTDVIPGDPSLAGLRETARPSPSVRITCAGAPSETDRDIEGVAPLGPFPRPPFPEKVGDLSTVIGLSSNTVLRTCFRIGEMINQSVRCLSHQQEVVFELFARVTYSNRENLERKQHFQFVDLFKDQQPYPAGILVGWRVGSQDDRQSSAFLNIKAKPKLCRCVCRPRREPKAATGLIFAILAIREVGWAQVRRAKKILCGDSDENGSAVTARL